MTETAPAPSDGSPGADPRDGVWEIIRGLWRFTALHSVVELRCADHLADGPLTVAELAGRCDAHPGALRRVLRSVAAAGLLTQVAPDTYALTDSGRTLCTGSPDSTWAAVSSIAHAASWDALGALPQGVRTGRAPFVEKYGPYYEYLAANPELGAVFNEHMRLRSNPVAAELAGRYDFTGAEVVMDVGGGKGTFLTSILTAHPQLRGVLFEREPVVPQAKENLEARGLTGRCDFVAGDFFTSVPATADTYLLANIIHNWDDDDALRILRNVRAALPAHGRVLLADVVLPDDDRPHLGKDLDVRMLVVFGGGGERTESEYFGLLARAGLRGRIAAPLPLGLSLIEALPGD
jgi:SAM-dependent methyltransferase